MRPRRYLIPIFVPHLGCPHACVFCNQRRISGAQRPAREEDVRRTISESLLRIPEGAAAEVAFYGGSFTAIPEDEQEVLLSTAGEFISLGRVASLRLSTRPDCIDDRTLGRLRSHGVATVELGSQSMCDEVLRLSGRGHRAEDTVRAAEMVKRAGFRLVLQMMTGLPGDTYERSIETARRIIGCAPDGVRIYPTVIVRDTELYDMWKRGEYHEHTVDDAVELCADLADMFEKAGIPIIRLGLNPTEDLSSGDAAGGAYHPALGEMVYSRLYLNRARALLSGVERGSIVTIGVHRGRVSVMVGQHRSNVLALKRELELADIKIREADVKDGKIEIIAIEKN